MYMNTHICVFEQIDLHKCSAFRIFKAGILEDYECREISGIKFLRLWDHILFEPLEIEVLCWRIDLKIFEIMIRWLELIKMHIDRSPAHRSVSRFIQRDNGGIKEHSAAITQVYIQNFSPAKIDLGFFVFFRSFPE